jgi:hypothetical protein
MAWRAYRMSSLKQSTSSSPAATRTRYAPDLPSILVDPSHKDCRICQT